MTDAELLQQFTSGQDEAAFRELTRRHAGLVYNTAKRSSSDEELAREVTQSVFLVLAQKAARLRPKPSLAGWLHRTALLLTRNAVRRKNRYLRAITAMETLISTACNETPDNALHSVLPHLDEALERLPEKDREVLLAHYYGGRTYREIAALRRESETAVQRRASRALEKLTASLLKQGIAVPGIALAAGLSTVLREPAPAGMVIMDSIPAAAPAGFQLHPVLSQAAVLLLAGGLSCAASYAFSDNGLSIVNEPLAPSAGRLAVSTDSTGNPPSLTIDVTGPAGDWRGIVERAAAELRSGGRLSLMRAAWRLSALKEDEFSEALQWAAALPQEDQARTELAAALLGLWGKHDPHAAWAAFGSFPEKGVVFSLGKGVEGLFLKLWDADSAACVAGLASLKGGQMGARWAALKLHESQPDRQRWMDEVAATPSDSARLKGASLTLNYATNNTETRGECFSWLISLPFQDAGSRNKVMDLLADQLAHPLALPVEPEFSRWLAGLDESVSAPARTRIQEALLRASEENRLKLARVIQDPALRRALQESL